MHFAGYIMSRCRCDFCVNFQLFKWTNRCDKRLTFLTYFSLWLLHEAFPIHQFKHNQNLILYLHGHYTHIIFEGRTYFHCNSYYTLFQFSIDSQTKSINKYRIGKTRWYLDENRPGWTKNFDIKEAARNSSRNLPRFQSTHGPCMHIRWKLFHFGLPDMLIYFPFQHSIASLNFV